jgi:hypothetical protein
MIERRRDEQLVAALHDDKDEGKERKSQKSKFHGDRASGIG